MLTRARRRLPFVVAIKDSRVTVCSSGRARAHLLGEATPRSVPGSTYGFYSVATDGVGHVQATTKRPDLKAKVVCKRKVCSVTSTSASWDAVVASAVQKGRVLTLRLRRAALTSLQVRVNGRKRATARKGHAPAAIRLSKLPRGAYTVTLLAQTKSGPLTATRASSGCKLPATKKH